MTINEENGRVGYDKCIDEKMKCDAKCPSDDSGEHCVENFTMLWYDCECWQSKSICPYYCNGKYK